jgi:hypothetical protein
MTINLEKISLRDSHTFTVNVKDGQQTFAGELSLSPEKITLKVMGEENEERKCGIGWSDIQTLTCTDLNSTFHLLGLKCNSSLGMALEHFPKSRSYFEIHFEAEYVIYSPSYMTQNPTFNGLKLQFAALPDWLGRDIRVNSPFSIFT